MSFFDRFRKAKSTEKVGEKVVARVEGQRESIPIPEFFEVEAEEKELVSLIASSIIAGDRSDSELRVKKVLARNDEKAVVTAIASAILAGDQPESTFRLKSIVRTK